MSRSFSNFDALRARETLGKNTQVSLFKRMVEEMTRLDEVSRLYIEGIKCAAQSVRGGVFHAFCRNTGAFSKIDFASARYAL